MTLAIFIVMKECHPVQLYGLLHVLIVFAPHRSSVAQRDEQYQTGATQTNKQTNKFIVGFRSNQGIY